MNLEHDPATCAQCDHITMTECESCTRKLYDDFNAKMRRVDERAALVGYCVMVCMVLGVVTLLVWLLP